MDPISKLNLFPALQQLNPTERVGAEGRAKHVQPLAGSEPQGYNPFGPISKINGELSPSITGGTTGITGPELRNGVSGKKFDLLA